MNSSTHSPKRNSEVGQMIISVMLASVCIIIFLAVYQAGFGGMKSRTLNQTQRLTADLAVAELLEYFRGQSQASLLQYFSDTPVVGDPTQAYYYCAHINLLNRTSGKILNRDDLAAMPNSWLDTPGSFMLGGSNVFGAVNRYYQVFQVNPLTMQIESDVCAQRMGTVAVAPSRKLMISVGVTWIPKKYQGNTLADVVQGASASVLIPK